MNTLNTTSGSIDTTPVDGSMEAAFTQYLEDKQLVVRLHNHEIEELKDAFYSGAQALLDAANPLSQIVVLQSEINDYLNPEEETQL